MYTFTKLDEKKDEEEKMIICSEPSSPERMINSNLNSFLSGDFKLEAEITECCLKSSQHHQHHTSNNMVTDENDFDWKFDSLFGNDSNLITSCLASNGEDNFGTYLSSSSATSSHIDNSSSSKANLVQLLSPSDHSLLTNYSSNSHHQSMIINNSHNNNITSEQQSTRAFLTNSKPHHGFSTLRNSINLNQSSTMNTSHDGSPFDNNSMDFIDNEDIPTSDEILFGLDGFDIFNHFDHLVDELSQDSHTNQQQQQQQCSKSNQTNDSSVNSSSLNINSQEQLQSYQGSSPTSSHASLLSANVDITFSSSVSESTNCTISSHNNNSLPSSGLLPYGGGGSSFQYNKNSSLPMKNTCTTTSTVSQLSNYKANHVDNSSMSMSGNLSPTDHHNGKTNMIVNSTAGNKKCLVSTLMIDHSNENKKKTDNNSAPNNANTETVQTQVYEKPSSSLLSGLNPSGSDVCHSIAVTVDQNGNVSMIKTSSTPSSTSVSFDQQNQTFIRRTASAGHQASRQAHLSEANLHRLSDSESGDGGPLNDISDNDEGHTQLVNFANKNSQNFRPRQRHMSDIYSSGRLSKEAILDSSRNHHSISSVVVQDNNGNNSTTADGTKITNNSDSTYNEATIADYSPEWCYPEGMFSYCTHNIAIVMAIVIYL